MQPGRIFSPDASDLLAVATKHHGNVQQIAKHYDVHKDTIYEYFKRDPKGKEIIDTVRSYNTENFLDTAEAVLLYNLNRVEKNPSLAQRAAEKVLDGKGYIRGWNLKDTSVDASPKQQDIDLHHENMLLRNKIAQLEANGNKPEARQELCGGDTQV